MAVGTIAGNYNPLMIAGVVLAAGRSARMGQSKALLTAGSGRTFVSALVAALRAGGVHLIAVVGRPGDLPLRAEVEREGVARFVENVRADEGQLSSVWSGLDVADEAGADALLIAPVDAPGVSAVTVAQLITAFRASGAPVARAVHQTRHGHPVLFSRELFAELRAASPSVGAKAVVRAHAVLDVEVEDAGVLDDVDTPADYDRWLERRRGSGMEG